MRAIRAAILASVMGAVAACGADAPAPGPEGGADAAAPDAAAPDAVAPDAAAPDAATADAPAAGCAAAADGTPCDDGNACTIEDACEGGVCVGATSRVCESGPCAVSSCDPAIGCVSEALGDGAACTLGCFGAATCQGGACTGTPDTEVACPPPDDPCVERLECDGTTGACTVEVPRTTGASCDTDDDVCTLEVCDQDGACVTTGQTQSCDWQAKNDPCWTYACDPTKGCTQAAWVEGASCNDESPCTSDDRCTTAPGGARACVGKPLPTDDGNPCTDDLCTGGKVVHTVLDGVPCTPSHPCATAGLCEAGVCVTTASACACEADADCDDGDACTAESCEDGECTATAASCDDGNPCTADSCDPATGCVHTGGAAPEACNGADDDCDGQTDEGFDVGAPCDGPDADACAFGQVACAPDGTAVCGPESVTDVPELCNGADDDCDGQTDEGYGVGEPCDGEDADSCATGTAVCAPDEAGVVCPGELVTDIPEGCNGKDDDCDGETDEGFGVGEPCDGPDTDLCPNGVLACAAGGVGVVCGPESEEDLAELCNGEDDDCDGATDEDFPSLGGPCDGGDDDLCADGTLACAPDGSLACDEPGDGAAELCNGEDDDCDGDVDEGLGVGDPCDGPDDDLCANGALACAPDGGVTCGPEALESIAEACNGLDDDCDGATDEGFADLGEPCDGPDTDLCATGTTACTADGAGTACHGEVVTDVVELCNGKDDDCDGGVDEGFDVGAPCDGPDADLCATGALACTPDGFGVTCGAEADPDRAELCNGADDDCDGATDEGFEAVGSPCDGPDTDDCALGVVACTADGLGTVCGPESATDLTEVCNGTDDDCDGQTDEGYPGVGEACDGPDADDCKNGVVTCDPDGAGTHCAGEDTAGTVELCNGADDDCDGAVDEDWPDKGAACDGDDADACEDGKLVCAAGGAGLVCDDSPAAVAEVCNGKDDDCDGQTDEGFALGVACDGADADLCEDDATACDGAGGVTCKDQGPPLAETCNGADDDCDGLTDEAWPAKGQPCDGGDADLCADGTLACTTDGAGLACNDDPASVAELCNGADDDCDGAVDEDWPTLGQSCDGDDDDLCTDGLVGCAADGAGVTCKDDAASSVELCNEQDDDCDGAVDEDFPKKGEACDGTDDDVCKDGTFVCGKKGALVCDDDHATKTEVCNGKDDDCDGATDEGFDVGAPCDSGDADQCEDDVRACTLDGAGTLCLDKGKALVEACNG